jgi:hypothetical protein
MCIIAHTADDVVSKKKTDDEIGSYTITLNVEMLRCGSAWHCCHTWGADDC